MHQARRSCSSVGRPDAAPVVSGVSTFDGVRRVVIALLVAGIVLSVPAREAGAHEPVFVTDADSTPAQGPLLVDGNHSFAVYGVLTEPGATRGFRSRLIEGQPLIADLLVPALSPERELGPGELPQVTIRWPDGTTRTLESALRVPFDEPFSRTSYIRIAELRELVAQTGTYDFRVRGRAPARFTLATGTVEGFGGDVRGARPAPAAGIAGWYATAPPLPPTEPTESPSMPRRAVDDDSSESTWKLPVVVAVAAVILAAGGLLVARNRRRQAS
jgi:hypothetical protein